MNWPWSRKRGEKPSALISIGDPAAAGYFIPGGLVDFAGVAVNERSALGLSAFYRAGSLISGTLASLPLRSLREKDGVPERVPSIFDNPDGDDGQTPFEWLETLFLHLFVHGRSYAIKLRNEAGALVRLPLVHPLCVQVEKPTPDEYREPAKMPVGGKWFNLQLDNGEQVRWDARDIWEIPGQTTDGFSCFSLINLARNSLATAIAGDRAAAVMFGQGALISGLVSPEDDLEPDEVKDLRKTLDRSVSGYENAGRIAIVNRRLNFTPWTMTAVDAQFLQSRQFQIEDVARWTGVPPHLLMQTEKQTSWGTGVEEQNRALGRTVLNPYGTRFEQRASRLLARPRWVEFDFAGLERPSPDKEIELLLKQTGGKPILTQNEARKVRNLPPVKGGDVLDTAAPAPVPPADPEPTPDEPPAKDDPEGDDDDK